MRGRKAGGFLDQSGWSIAVRGKGEWTNDEVTSEFSQSHFTLVKHKRHRKAVSVQNAEDYKTLIFMLLGEITFVIRPDCIFVNFWGACDSSVLQCSDQLDARSSCLEGALWRPCNFIPIHSLTGPMGQPFASRLGGHGSCTRDAPSLTMEPGSHVSAVSLQEGTNGLRPRQVQE